MGIQTIEGHTRDLAENQSEYHTLPIRDVLIETPTNGLVPAMISEWRPTLEELKALNAGSPVRLSILGTTHPPVMLTVGDDTGATVDPLLAANSG